MRFAHKTQIPIIFPRQLQKFSLRLFIRYSEAMLTGKCLALCGSIAFATFVNAHFQMQYPEPRGAFVEDDEPSFCGELSACTVYFVFNGLTFSLTHADGYTNAVDNRTVFPFGQGFITLNSEHPTWTGEHGELSVSVIGLTGNMPIAAQVLISTDQNPTNFSQFNTSSGAAVPFFKASGAGLACIAIDIENLNITGVKDGSNVTIQLQFEGGDGDLFQVGIFFSAYGEPFINEHTYVISCSAPTLPSRVMLLLRLVSTVQISSRTRLRPRMRPRRRRLRVVLRQAPQFPYLRRAVDSSGF